MYLLDTCTLLWLAGGDPEKLSENAAEALRRDARLAVSAISALEIGLKARRGALTLPVSSPEWFERALAHHGLYEIPVSGSIAASSTLLPPIHWDPCDRVIVSTARAYNLTVLTPDRHISDYPDVDTLW